MILNFLSDCLILPNFGWVEIFKILDLAGKRGLRIFKHAKYLQVLVFVKMISFNFTVT